MRAGAPAGLGSAALHLRAWCARFAGQPGGSPPTYLMPASSLCITRRLPPAGRYHLFLHELQFVADFVAICCRIFMLAQGESLPLAGTVSQLMEILTSAGIGNRPVVFVCHRRNTMFCYCQSSADHHFTAKNAAAWAASW